MVGAERGQHPALEGLPKVTRNADGIPGDPLNVGLVGSKDELIAAMLAAGWHPADPITLRSSLGSPPACCSTAPTRMPR